MSSSYEMLYLIRPVPGREKDRKIPLVNQKQMIDRCTHRETLVFTMMMIAKNGIGPKELLAASEANNGASVILMVLAHRQQHEEYNPRMEVELKMGNCVNIDTLLSSNGKMMTGKFFLCRTIVPSSKMIGVDTVVDDPEGMKAIRLTLCNYSLSAQMGVTDFETVLPAGTIIIIKNPHFQVVDDETPMCGLICENPSDVMLLSPKKMKEMFPHVKFAGYINSKVREWIGALVWENLGETNTQCAIKLKNLANKGFMQKRWTDAIRFYDLALNYVSTDEDAVAVDVLSNKAAALVSMGCFNQALVCCDRVLDVDPAHLKAVYRRTKAIIGLVRYKEAGEFVDDKLNKFPSLGESNDILKMRSNISQLCLPLGNDVISSLVKEMRQEGDYPPLTTADRTPDFMGHVEFRACDKGMGVFATQDIQPEELLIVCRPFAAFYVKASEVKTFEMNTTPHEEVVGMMANKVVFDPQLGRELYKLWAGPELKCLDDNDSNITKVDMKRIDAIASFNFTGANHDKVHHISGGIWLASSKINHSCSDANVMYDHHHSGLLMVVRAFKPVKQGQEILQSYVDPELPLKERDFLKSHAFVCNCRLCQLDKSELQRIHKQRKILIDSLAYDHKTNLYPYIPAIFSKDLQTISKLVDLRENAPELNIVLLNSGIHTISAVVLFDQRRYEECIDILKKMFLVAQNFPPNFTRKTHKIAAGILLCYMKLKMKKEMRNWTEEVRKWYRLYYGDLESIRKDYPKLPEDLAKFGIDFFSR